MITLQPTENYATKEAIYQDYEFFINSSKHCVRIDELNKKVCIDDSSKFEALKSYVENFVFAVKDLLVNKGQYISLSLDSIKKEMEWEFCVPTERQFQVVVATIKAELRDKFTLIESPNHLTISRV